MSSSQSEHALDLLLEISTILNTGLSKEELSILVALCEQGVNPEALVEVVKELHVSQIASRSHSVNSVTPVEFADPHLEFSDSTTAMSNPGVKRSNLELGLLDSKTNNSTIETSETNKRISMKATSSTYGVNNINRDLSTFSPVHSSHASKHQDSLFQSHRLHSPFPTSERNNTEIAPHLSTAQIRERTPPRDTSQRTLATFSPLGTR